MRHSHFGPSRQSHSVMATSKQRWLCSPCDSVSPSVRDWAWMIYSRRQTHQLILECTAWMLLYYTYYLQVGDRNKAAADKLEILICLTAACANCTKSGKMNHGLLSRPDYSSGLLKVVKIPKIFFKSILVLGFYNDPVSCLLVMTNAINTQGGWLTYWLVIMHQFKAQIGALYTHTHKQACKHYHTHTQNPQ